MRKFPELRKIAYFSVLIIIHLFSSTLIPGRITALSANEKGLNLLIITVDTLRADHVGIYGYKKIETPNIDRLGEKGVLFSRAYCHVPLTLPSHWF